MINWSAAACAEGHIDPEWFFPAERLVGSDDVYRAKLICAGCPLRQACLAAHLDDEYGTFGGMTAGERRRIADGQSLPLVNIAERDYAIRLPGSLAQRELAVWSFSRGASRADVAGFLGVSERNFLSYLKRTIRAIERRTRQAGEVLAA